MVALAILDIWLLIKLIEYLYCAFVLHQPPFVPSNKKLRQLIAREINLHYPNTQRICEIGSGHGGLVRYIARHTRARVYGIENMPWAILNAKFFGMFCPRAYTIWMDAFEYLGMQDQPFDVAIAYLSPAFTQKLTRYGNCFRVLISIDFECAGKTPRRVIDLGRGYTRYMGKKYPHRLYIYEFGPDQK